MRTMQLTRVEERRILEAGGLEVVEGVSCLPMPHPVRNGNGWHDHEPLGRTRAEGTARSALPMGEDRARQIGDLANTLSV